MRASSWRRSWLARSSSPAICDARVAILGQDQLEAGVGTVQPPGRVQPRRQRERDGALVDACRGRRRRRPSARAARAWSCPPARAARDARACGSRPAAGPRRRSSRAPPGRDPARASGARASRGRVRLPPRPPRRRRARRSAPARACRRPRSRTGPRTGSRTVAGCTIGACGSTPSARGAWWSVTTTSMPSARASCDLLDGGDRAVDRHQQPRAARGEPAHGRRVQTVAVARAVGQVEVDVGSELAQRAHQHGCRADAVDVVVAVDRDPRAVARRGAGSQPPPRRCPRRPPAGAPRRPPGRPARRVGSARPRRTSTCASAALTPSSRRSRSTSAAGSRRSQSGGAARGETTGRVRRNRRRKPAGTGGASR